VRQAATVQYQVTVNQQRALVILRPRSDARISLAEQTTRVGQLVINLSGQSVGTERATAVAPATRVHAQPLPLHYPAIRELTSLTRQLSARQQFPASQVVQRRCGNRQPAVALKHATVIQDSDRQRGITRRQLTCVIQPCGRQGQPLLSEQPSILLVRQQ